MVPARTVPSSRLLLLCLVAACISVTGCEVVGGIFKAGMWVGVIMVVLVVAIIMFVMGKARG
jgi:hypothetical protein